MTMSVSSKTCAECRRPMIGSSCTWVPGLRTRRQERDFLINEAGWEPFEIDAQCWDCGAVIDGYHHPQCCKAMCFNEHAPDGRMAQRLMCGCDD